MKISVILAIYKVFCTNSLKLIKKIQRLYTEEKKRKEFCLKKNQARANVKSLCAKLWMYCKVCKPIFNVVGRSIAVRNGIKDTSIVYKLWRDYIISLIDGRDFIVSDNQVEILETVRVFGFDTYIILKRINSKLDFSKLEKDVMKEMAYDLAKCVSYDPFSLIFERKTIRIYDKNKVKRLLTEKILIYKSKLSIRTDERVTKYKRLSYFPIYNLTNYKLLRIQDKDCDDLLTRHTREVNEIDNSGNLHFNQRINNFEFVGAALFIIALITLIVSLISVFKRK